MARRWTEREVKVLLSGLGAYGIEWFRQRTGTSYLYPNAPPRSANAIHRKIARLCGGSGRFTRGAYTLAALAKRSGYHHKQLRRAQSALNQKWKRTSSKGSYLITDDQAEEALTWLEHDYWCRSRRLYGCVQCGEDKSPPKVWGLCGRCYARVYWAVKALRGKLVGADRAVLEQFMVKVKAGRGFQWSQLRELKARSQ